jgi:hypothetical protein
LVNRGRYTLRALATRSLRNSTRPRLVRQPPKRSGRPALRGASSNSAFNDYWLKPGPGRKRLPHDALGVGERLPSPRLYTHCWQGHKTESSSAHASHAVGRPDLNRGPLVPQTTSTVLRCSAVGWREVAMRRAFEPITWSSKSSVTSPVVRINAPGAPKLTSALRSHRQPQPIATKPRNLRGFS